MHRRLPLLLLIAAFAAEIAGVVWLWHQRTFYFNLDRDMRKGLPEIYWGNDYFEESSPLTSFLLSLAATFVNLILAFWYLRRSTRRELLAEACLLPDAQRVRLRLLFPPVPIALLVIGWLLPAIGALSLDIRFEGEIPRVVLFSPVVALYLVAVLLAERLFALGVGRSINACFILIAGLATLPLQVTVFFCLSPLLMIPLNLSLARWLWEAAKPPPS